MRWVFIPASSSAYAFGDCLEFDGTDDFCTMPTAMTSESFTLSMWVNLDSTSLQTLISSTTNTTSFIRVFDSTTIGFRPTTVRTTFTFPTISTGAWYHLLVASNGAICRMFLNGVESSTGSVSVSNIGISFDRISGRGLGDQFFDGLMDDLVCKASYGDPATEATALYNGGAGVDPSTVLTSPGDWFKFNGNGNNDGSNGGVLTLNNFPADPYTPHL